MNGFPKFDVKLIFIRMRTKKSNKTNVNQIPDFSKTYAGRKRYIEEGLKEKEVFELDTSEPTIFDNDEEDEEDEFSPYEVFREI